jgi:hypothetical protein
MKQLVGVARAYLDTLDNRGLGDFRSSVFGHPENQAGLVRAKSSEILIMHDNY